MKNKTWQKIGELLLDYSKIFIAIGIVAPFINSKSVNTLTEYAIIALVIILTITGILAYNKGVEDE